MKILKLKDVCLTFLVILSSVVLALEIDEIHGNFGEKITKELPGEKGGGAEGPVDDREEGEGNPGGGGRAEGRGPVDEKDEEEEENPTGRGGGGGVRERGGKRRGRGETIESLISMVSEGENVDSFPSPPRESREATAQEYYSVPHSSPTRKLPPPTSRSDLRKPPDIDGKIEMTPSPSSVSRLSVPLTTREEKERVRTEGKSKQDQRRLPGYRRRPFQQTSGSRFQVTSRGRAENVGQVLNVNNPHDIGSPSTHRPKETSIRPSFGTTTIPSRLHIFDHPSPTDGPVQVDGPNKLNQSPRNDAMDSPTLERSDGYTHRSRFGSTVTPFVAISTRRDPEVEGSNTNESTDIPGVRPKEKSMAQQISLDTTNFLTTMGPLASHRLEDWIGNNTGEKWAFQASQDDLDDDIAEEEKEGEAQIVYGSFTLPAEVSRVPVTEPNSIRNLPSSSHLESLESMDENLSKTSPGKGSDLSHHFSMRDYLHQRKYKTNKAYFRPQQDENIHKLIYEATKDIILNAELEERRKALFTSVRSSPTKQYAPKFVDVKESNRDTVEENKASNEELRKDISNADRHEDVADDGKIQQALQDQTTFDTDYMMDRDRTPYSVQEGEFASSSHAQEVRIPTPGVRQKQNIKNGPHSGGRAQGVHFEEVTKIRPSPANGNRGPTNNGRGSDRSRHRIFNSQKTRQNEALRSNLHVRSQKPNLRVHRLPKSGGQKNYQNGFPQRTQHDIQFIRTANISPNVNEENNSRPTIAKENQGIANIQKARVSNLNSITINPTNRRPSPPPLPPFDKNLNENPFESLIAMPSLANSQPEKTNLYLEADNKGSPSNKLKVTAKPFQETKEIKPSIGKYLPTPSHNQPKPSREVENQKDVFKGPNITPSLPSHVVPVPPPYFPPTEPSPEMAAPPFIAAPTPPPDKLPPLPSLSLSYDINYPEFQKVSKVVKEAQSASQQPRQINKDDGEYIDSNDFHGLIDYELQKETAISRPFEGGGITPFENSEFNGVSHATSHSNKNELHPPNNQNIQGYHEASQQSNTNKEFPSRQTLLKDSPKAVLSSSSHENIHKHTENKAPELVSSRKPFLHEENVREINNRPPEPGSKYPFIHSNQRNKPQPFHQDNHRQHPSSETRRPQFNHNDGNPHLDRENRPPFRNQNTRVPQFNQDQRRPQNSRENERPQFNHDTRRPHNSRENERPQFNHDTRRPQFNYETRGTHFEQETRRPQFNQEARRPQFNQESRRPTNFDRNRRPHMNIEHQVPFNAQSGATFVMPSHGPRHPPNQHLPPQSVFFRTPPTFLTAPPSQIRPLNGAFKDVNPDFNLVELDDDEILSYSESIKNEHSDGIGSIAPHLFNQEFKNNLINNGGHFPRVHQPANTFHSAGPPPASSKPFRGPVPSPTLSPPPSALSHPFRILFPSSRPPLTRSPNFLQEPQHRSPPLTPLHTPLPPPPPPLPPPHLIQSLSHPSHLPPIHLPPKQSNQIRNPQKLTKSHPPQKLPNNNPQLLFNNHNGPPPPPSLPPHHHIQHQSNRNRPHPHPQGRPFQHDNQQEESLKKPRVRFPSVHEMENDFRPMTELSQPLPRETENREVRLAESHAKMMENMQYGVDGSPLDVWIPITKKGGPESSDDEGYHDISFETLHDDNEYRESPETPFHGKFGNNFPNFDDFRDHHHFDIKSDRVESSPRTGGDQKAESEVTFEMNPSSHVTTQPSPTQGYKGPRYNVINFPNLNIVSAAS